MRKWQVTLQRSLTEETEDRLNNQVRMEGESSQAYLAMASWCETEGFENAANFLYEHAEEERMHMLKIMRYINEAGGHALAPEITNVANEFKDLREVFDQVLLHEIKVTKSINELVDHCFSIKDFTSVNFLQWYVTEQREEEALARRVIELFDIIGTEGQGMWLIEQEIGKLIVNAPVNPNEDPNA